MKRTEMKSLVQLAKEMEAEEVKRLPSLWRLLKRGAKNPQTLRSLKSDLDDFCGEEATDAMLWFLVTSNAERLHGLFEEYWADLNERQLKVSTLNRRLATLRRVLRVAHQNDLRPDDASKLRVLTSLPRIHGSTEPASLTAIEQLLQEPDTTTMLGFRDRLLLLLIVRLSLSRTQIGALSVSDFDRQTETLLVLPLHKPDYLRARLQRAQQFLPPLPSAPEVPSGDASVSLEEAKKAYRYSLPTEVVQALEKYLSLLAESGFDIRAEAPLFRTLDRRHVKDASKNQRLTDDGVYSIVRRYAKRIGLESLNARSLQRAAQLHSVSDLDVATPTSSLNAKPDQS